MATAMLRVRLTHHSPNAVGSDAETRMDSRPAVPMALEKLDLSGQWISELRPSDAEREAIDWARDHDQRAPVEDRRRVVRIPAVRSSLRSKVLAGDAILDVSPPRSLVGDLLQLDSLAAIYGPPASGKSFLALDVALSVASSQPWQGKDVVDGPVVYVIAEDVPGTALRARAWRSRHQSLGNIHWLPTRVPLLESESLAELCDVVAETAPALIVVDTLARTMVGSDESSTRDMGLAVDALDRLRAVLGSCVLIVHHSGKDGSRGMRGSIALLAATDTAIECKRTRDGLTAQVAKQKNGADGQRMHFRIEPEGESAVLVASEASSDAADAFRPTELMRRVSIWLETNPDASVRAIRDAKLGRRAEYVDLAVACLIREGFVTTTPGARGASLHRSVTPFVEGADDAA
ncbi:MAG TPA: AAA family ATPase [Candidatus Saccharimonadales bacterium]|nr:AAA family ATPase [Candidatus Saccharimonadales bacterium]HVC42362.1 AAA family ATPase [Candidatus Saccharimonadales bacterium]